MFFHVPAVLGYVLFPYSGWLRMGCCRRARGEGQRRGPEERARGLRTERARGFGQEDSGKRIRARGFEDSELRGGVKLRGF